MPEVRVTMKTVIDVKIGKGLTEDQIRECVEKAIADAKKNDFNFDESWEWVDESKVPRSIDWNADQWEYEGEYEESLAQAAERIRRRV